MSNGTQITRRRLLRDSTVAGAGIALGTHRAVVPVIQGSSGVEVSRPSGKNLYWGDIHNHNAVGYAQGSPETGLTISLTQPVQQTITKSLKQLAQSSDTEITGPFASESILLHRLAFAENYRTEFELGDEREPKGTDWYYIRVVQTNGSIAWSSPIWLSPASTPAKDNQICGVRTFPRQAQAGLRVACS